MDFTPQQQYSLLSKMGYQGPEDPKMMAAFLSSNPAAAARMGKFSRVLEKRIGMASGGFASLLEAFKKGKDNTASNTTGTEEAATTEPVDFTPVEGQTRDLSASRQEVAKLTDAVATAARNAEANPNDSAAKAALEDAQKRLTEAQGTLSVAQTQAAANMPSGGETASKIFGDPTSMVVGSDVAKVGAATPEQLIDESAGQVTDKTTTSAATVGTAATADTPEKMAAATYTAEGATPGVTEAAEKAKAVTGTVSDKALVDAAQGTDLAQLDLEAKQIAEAQTIKAPADRVLQEGELIDGSSVNMDKVNKALEIEAATAQPSKKATVQGQLESLTENFDAKNPPAWAAGALRAANAELVARGLGASSIAGQAIVQATLESAIPIAQADANTVAQFEAQNLSNRQQAALFAAEQRANFLNLEFNQDFQAKVANAARIGEIANINFTAQQQIALENARMAQTVDIANLDAANAKVLADAAALTQLDLTNLNNRQQAAVANAKSFLDMDLTNIANENAVSMFRNQAIVNSMLSDTAARNAAEQFNAASENQTNQFFADLESTISRFNVDQKNAIAQFDAGEINAADKFNAQLEAARQQFNAQNNLIIKQANAKWRQDITTMDTAAQNEANMEAARTANALTVKALDDLWQRQRDLMAFAFTAAENELDRAASLLETDKALSTEKKLAKMGIDAQEDRAMSSMAASVLFGGGGGGGILGGLFG